MAYTLSVHKKLMWEAYSVHLAVWPSARPARPAAYPEVSRRKWNRDPGDGADREDQAGGRARLPPWTSAPSATRIEDQVRTHVFLRMLSYYITWHMQARLAPIMFTDDKTTAQAARQALSPPPSAPRGPCQSRHQAHRGQPFPCAASAAC
jgi:hypothetical protein